MSGWPTFNSNHVAPYRSIIPLEAKLRSRHQFLEHRFKELSAEDPSHPAVTRKCDFIPTFLVSSGPADKCPGRTLPDPIDNVRVNLDGFRALIAFLDTDVSTLVRSYRDITAGTATSLPFEHLWFLYTQPIAKDILVHMWPRKVQCNRVFRVVGGRRSLTKEQGTYANGWSPWTNLQLECVFLELGSDSTNFQVQSHTLTIPPYLGTKKIQDLPFVPLSFHKPLIGFVDRDENKLLVDALYERGRRCWGLLRAPAHKRYQGLSFRDTRLRANDAVEEVSVVSTFLSPILARYPESHIPGFKF